MNNKVITDKILLDSSDKSFHAFGFSYIYTKRVEKYLFYVNGIKYLGIIVPLIVGALALGYEYKYGILAIAIKIAIPFTVFQLILSVHSIVYKWDDELAYAFEAIEDYNYLYDEYKKLYFIPTVSYSGLYNKYNVLNSRLTSRENQDNKHKITDKELRMGMRYSLREHKKACAGCNIIPVSMKASKCDVCGNF